MADDYFYQEFPKYLYHPNGSWTVVQDADQEQAMSGQGFVRSPAEYGVETAQAAPTVQPGGFPQPGYVSPSAGGGAGSSSPLPSSAGGAEPSPAAAAQHAETQRQQEAGNRQAASTSASQSAQADVERLQQEAAQRRKP